MKALNNIFPITIEKYWHDGWMGEYIERFRIFTNDGRHICTCDYETSCINEISSTIQALVMNGGTQV